ncbi:MAG: metal-binding protein [Thermoplasmataceae archaeon]
MIEGDISLEREEGTLKFHMIFSYSDSIDADRNLAGLVLAMPAINFCLFSRKLTLNFPASKSDVAAIQEFVRINNREVFINKLARRRYEFFKQEYVPGDEDITEENSNGNTLVLATSEFEDIPRKIPGKSNAVLSSGGKESLLSYGMLKDIDPDTHAFYFNESGGHWLTAKTAYDYYSAEFSNVHKVWSNVDRFYRYVLRNMTILDQRIINTKTDTYPVQLFIFPVYVMSMIPVAIKHGINGAVLGDEFDDPSDMQPFHGIRHYYGIYDQTLDFNRFMTGYLHSKGIDFTVWSAVYPVTGGVVENILIKRYPDLFRLQRSCHSCRSIKGKIIPCGKCSKCLGILMFILSAGGDPHDILYSTESIENLKDNVSREKMRLDTDELNYMKARLGFIETSEMERLQHVSGMHLLPGEEQLFQHVPDRYREGIMKIISQYAPVSYTYTGGSWEKSEKQ